MEKVGDFRAFCPNKTAQSTTLMSLTPTLGGVLFRTSLFPTSNPNSMKLLLHLMILLKVSVVIKKMNIKK